MPRLHGVVFVFVGELFARENFVLLRQEWFQRRTLRKSNGPLVGVGERGRKSQTPNDRDQKGVCLGLLMRRAQPHHPSSACSSARVNSLSPSRRRIQAAARLSSSK